MDIGFTPPSTSLHTIIMKQRSLIILADAEWRAHAEQYKQYLPMCFRIGGIAIQNYMKEHGIDHPDFAWLQTDLLRPAFQHLCFRHRLDVYSILIAIQGLITSSDGEYFVSRQDYDNLLRESQRNNLIPCILPVSVGTKKPIEDGVHLFHAQTEAPIQLDNGVRHGQVPMSAWEVNSMGVQIVVQNLRKEGIERISFCDVAGVAPQIWFEKGGKRNFVIVRTTSAGKSNSLFEIKKSLLSRLADSEGYFADVQLASGSAVLKDEYGNIVPLSKRFGKEDVWLWRGDGFIIKYRGIQQLGQAIRENAFIKVVE